MKNVRWSWLLVGLICLVMCLGMCMALPAWAQSVSLSLPGTNTGAAEGAGGSTAERVLQLVALLTILSLAPSILMMMTSFTRMVVVLSFVRSALGTQQSPPNAVMVGLAMFLSLFVMQPTLQNAWDTAISPMMQDEMTLEEGLPKAVIPFKTFMQANVRAQDLTLFADLAQAGPFEDAEAIPLRVIVPAFMISELRRAFEIGFLIFLPFLIIDMVVASILMAMGMMMVPPVTVALPFKIIFFVLVDGWGMIAGSLVKSYNSG